MAKPSGRIASARPGDRRSGLRRTSDSAELVPSASPREWLIEQHLRESQKLEALGALAGGIAHDFNNILNIVSSYASLIARDSAATPAIVERVDAIQRTIGRGAGVVRQLVTIARRGDAIFAPVQVNKVIDELARLIRETFPRSIDLDVQTVPSVPPIKADADQLMQALLNLCLNSRDAMPSGGRLTLESRCVESAAGATRVGISVTDTGVGMEERIRARAFEPFFTTKERGGTGLGLPMVAGIVEGHNGRIQIESAPGEGTRVRLDFPAAEAIPAEELVSHPEGPLPSSRGRTVLLVED